ncbi:sulfide/dihydroorotate dehydrogenase-like FAD/NAD-binding protein [Faecalicoccus pleomorphus]|uniref:sulfide/dihydroorotate dehydrogenase-like FAD/NAD-binding protein n=1 Tax=Faecalicoccus pleomorphus TaxID=1323 RepID=UPI00232A91DC|nr:sulfide/dihydroorotate dehydrogenase-like FAD/NAD-binding protein [Faecalicoccus pleomorphus]MDB7985883.1 sulfide/dihydroorotate dehydrogenase-like FAD/NAD-binding protein [Faecalicoccus pleomorphus]MDB7991650.1 sulfide/dihydroorotate dehydrogenase-like FAD/NAD-binding protein [Faecalicoccus pleomorphus]
MYKILKKEALNPTVTRMVIEAPFVAKRAKAGQFIILRVREQGERLPLTIADSNPEKGTVTIIFQVVGETTMLLNALNEGDCLEDFAGPLGKSSLIDGTKKVCIIGGGVGCAIAYPTAKAFHEAGADVTTIVGFRNKDLVILEEEFKKVSDAYYLMSDDGSVGEKGLVTNKLEDLIIGGEKFDEVVAIGPIVMMKFVSLTTKKYNIPTTVSMNPVMIDGTGMCGGCRLKVGDEIKFACVDGPDFDGHLVDFDQAMARNTAYKSFEAHKRDEACHLLNKEVD